MRGPEENEHAERDDKFFGRRKSENRGGVLERPIEENVVPLAHDVEARGLAFLDQLGEPGVVGMAGEIAGFDAAMPQARGDHYDRYDENQPFVCTNELPSRRGLHGIDGHLPSRLRLCKADTSLRK